MSSCPSCNAEVPGGAAFCPTCGRSQDHDATDPIRLRGDTVAATTVMSATSGPDDTSVLPTVPGRFLEGTRCSDCGAQRDDDRVLCDVCGSPLLAGVGIAAPLDGTHVSGPDERVVGEPTLPEDRPGRRWGAWLVAALLVGALLGLAAAVVISRGGADAATDAPAAPEGPNAVFDPTDFPDDPVQLTVTATGATSTADGSDTALAVDGDAATAWRSGPFGGDEPRYAVELADESWVRSLRLVNGAPSADAGAMPGRAVRVLLVAGGEAVELVLLDADGVQQVTLPEPVLASRVELRVTESTPGTADGIALSELELIGHVLGGGGEV